MTIISNSFAPACRQLLPKYTISTLRSIDIVDNQKGYGCILKFTRFQHFKDRHLPFSGLSEKLSALSRQFLKRYSPEESIAMFHSEWPHWSGWIQNMSLFKVDSDRDYLIGQRSIYHFLNFQILVDYSFVFMSVSPCFQWCADAFFWCVFIF